LRKGAERHKKAENQQTIPDNSHLGRPQKKVNFNGRSAA
jgi:hypothetical protein